MNPLLLSFVLFICNFNDPIAKTRDVWNNDHILCVTVHDNHGSDLFRFSSLDSIDHVRNLTINYCVRKR